MVIKQKVRIKLKAYDPQFIEKATEKIVRTAKATGAQVSVIALPNKREIYTVLTSPHIDKKAREQFQLTTHKRSIEIASHHLAKTMEAVFQLELHTGVSAHIIEINA